MRSVRLPTCALTLAVLWAAPVRAQEAGADADLPDVAPLDAGPPQDAGDAALDETGSENDPDPPAPHEVAFGAEQSFDLAEGIRVTAQAPSTWREGDAETDPSAELAQIRGARLQVARAWTAEHSWRGRIVLVCASAPAEEWSHGFESFVFDRMNTLATAELASSMTVGSFTPGTASFVGSSYQQDFTASGQSGTAVKEGGVRVLEADDGRPRRSSRMTVAGRHSIAFSSKEAQPLVLLCSLACAEPARHEGAVCRNVLATHRFVGALGPEPQPTLPARFALGFARRPAAFAGIAAGLLSLLVGVVVVVRGLLIPPRT